MSGISIGDLAQQFTSLRNGAAIKANLFALQESLSSERVVDLAKTLGGETARYSGMTYSLTQLEGYGQAASETQQSLGTVQAILERVNETRAASAERLLLLSDDSMGAQIDEAAIATSGAFAELVTTLNTQVADRALMSGNSSQTTPLAAPAEMLANIKEGLAGVTDPAAIIATVETWFADPNGGFITDGYLGNTGRLIERRVSENISVTIDARADDPALRGVLQGAAIAALANELPGLSNEAKSTLLQNAGAQLTEASSGLIALQARVGFEEETVERAISQTTAQKTALGIAINSLSFADPFETASRLQSIQLQLETHFSVTARMSQLSLLRFI